MYERMDALQQVQMHKGKKVKKSLEQYLKNTGIQSHSFSNRTGTSMRHKFHSEIDPKYTEYLQRSCLKRH